MLEKASVDLRQLSDNCMHLPLHRERRERENKKFSKKGKASHKRQYLISYTDL
jgi:hypothetical protein